MDFFMSLGLWSGPWLELGYLKAAPVPQSLILGRQTGHPKCTPGKRGAGGAGWVPTSRGGVPWGRGGAGGGQGRPFQRGRTALAFKRPPADAWLREAPRQSPHHALFALPARVRLSRPGLCVPTGLAPPALRDAGVRAAPRHAGHAGHAGCVGTGPGAPGGAVSCTLRRVALSEPSLPWGLCTGPLQLLPGVRRQRGRTLRPPPGLAVRGQSGVRARRVPLPLDTHSVWHRRAHLCRRVRAAGCQPSCVADLRDSGAPAAEGCLPLW